MIRLSRFSLLGGRPAIQAQWRAAVTTIALRVGCAYVRAQNMSDIVARSVTRPQSPQLARLRYRRIAVARCVCLTLKTEGQMTRDEALAVLNVTVRRPKWLLLQAHPDRHPSREEVAATKPLL